MRRAVYTIAPERPFLATLAAALVAMEAGDPLRLTRAVVLLPTRRAVRALREAFLRVGDGAPVLLPRMRAIGDLDADELALGDEPADRDLPPAIPELRRRLLLTQLVLRWGGLRGAGALLPGQAAALAGLLARLIDTAATEGADLAGIADLVPPELAEHWQTVHRFLEILPRAWPGVLAAEGALDPGDRRNRLLRRQAAEWRRTPPRDPVIAAGLVGGVPAIAELLSVVAGLEHGAVILPGLDRRADAAEWAAIEEDETHPQHLLALLLQALEVAREDVREWPPAAAAAGQGQRAGPSARIRLVGEAMRPAATTEAWRDLGPEAGEALAGVRRFDCVSPQHEAVTIALLLRRKLEVPAATAALVTPDRDLARRVAAELRRWGIEIDDSAGVPLNRTPPGSFLRHVVELAESGWAPVPLLAALKHPLAAGGLAPARFRDLARRLECHIRGPRPAPGADGLRCALARGEAQLRRFVDRLETCLGPLPDLLAGEAVPLSRLVAAHVAAAERLAATDAEAGGDRLWAEAAGEAAARFCHELIAAAEDFPALAGRHYAALFEALAAGAIVRPAYGRHPRLAIWGLVESRLQQADLLVLGGLNEGGWPGPAEHDPWMSRQMRRDFGLAVPERRIGIAAHDFAQAMAAPEVALTRAARAEGAPTVPSRFLSRLDAVLSAVGLGGALGPDPEIELGAALIDAAAYRPWPAVQAAPPLAARPRRLSVTQIEEWFRDPYAIYARHILKLEKLEDLDADPGRAELGIRVHEALERFITAFPRGVPADAEEQLLRIGREVFGPILSRPGVWAFWWPRFERVARWFVAEMRRRADIVESRSECRGSLVIAAPGGPFELTAVADRIDRLRDGGLVLVDYKTGSLPNANQIERGVAPQLPLEGAILRDGSFGELTGSPEALEYWRLAGGDPPGERHPIGGRDPLRLVELLLARTRAVIARFDDARTPYMAVPRPRLAPRYSDYRHLERLGESEVEE